MSAAVPAGKVWIVTFAQINNESGSTGASCALYGAANVTLVSSSWPIYQGAFVMRFDGRYVMKAGEVLQIYPFSGPWSGFACGYELSAA